MRVSATACLLLLLGLIHPIHSLFPAHSEDMEGSGYGLDSSGSGSGDWSEQVSPREITKITDHPNYRHRPFDSTRWPTQDIGSEQIVLANSKSFMENTQLVAGVTAGGAIGVMLAITVASLLIYKWHHKQRDSGYIQGWQSHEKTVV